VWNDRGIDFVINFVTCNRQFRECRPTTIPKASFANSVRLTDLVKDGKIYLSLSDAIALAIENNYDIAIARYDLDIADTDILRTRTGRRRWARLPACHQHAGRFTSTLTTGGGPGGTTVGSGGAGSGARIDADHGGAGPTPESLDPSVTAAIQFDRAEHAFRPSFFSGGTSTTNTYNFTYNQGFVTGTASSWLQQHRRHQHQRVRTLYSPQLNSNFKATVTQHLLQGAGIWVNKRFMYQALNDRRITDSSFRQQILYTVNQVETIYWGLVQAYEDVQAKQRALEQSSKLAQRQPQAVGDRHHGAARRGQRRSAWPPTSRR
jgi:outer membrane protein